MTPSQNITSERMTLEINAALVRARRRGGKRLQLPQDFQLFPVLKVDGAGRCTGIEYWLARIGEHYGRGAQPLWAVRAVAAEEPWNDGGVA